MAFVDKTEQKEVKKFFSLELKSQILVFFYVHKK